MLNIIGSCIRLATVFNFFTGIGILVSVLQDPAVKANAPLHQHVSNIKGEGSKRAAALKSSITLIPTATTSRWVEGGGDASISFIMTLYDSNEHYYYILILFLHNPINS